MNVDIPTVITDGFALKFLVGTHKRNGCGGNVVIIAKDPAHFFQLNDPGCGPLPGDDAQCERCGTWLGYDGNFWTGYQDAINI